MANQRRFKMTPKILGHDEFLMALMKTRSGLIATDLSRNFTISGYPRTQIFYSWIKGMGEYFRSIVYISVNDQKSSQQLH